MRDKKMTEGCTSHKPAGIASGVVLRETGIAMSNRMSRTVSPDFSGGGPPEMNVRRAIADYYVANGVSPESVMLNRADLAFLWQEHGIIRRIEGPDGLSIAVEQLPSSLNE